jgi:hypothetical protein
MREGHKRHHGIYSLHGLDASAQLDPSKAKQHILVFFFIVRRRNRNCLRSEVEIRIEGGRELLILRVRGAQQELTLRTCSLLSILHPADRSFLLATTYVCYLLSIIYSPSCRSILLASYYVRLLPALYYLFSILQIDLSC